MISNIVNTREWLSYCHLGGTTIAGVSCLDGVSWVGVTSWAIAT